MPGRTGSPDDSLPGAAAETTPPAHSTPTPTTKRATPSVAPSDTSGQRRSACKPASGAKFAIHSARSTSGLLLFPRKKVSERHLSQRAKPTPALGRKLLVRGSVLGQLRRD